MGENIVEAQIDEHLMNIQRVTKMALNRFEESGQKIDRKFMNHFQSVTLDRVTQTCKRFEAELKWKTPRVVPEADTNSATPVINLANSPGGDQSKKRKTDGSEVVGVDEAKKAKLNESTENAVDEELEPQSKTAIFYCVHCFDQVDVSKAFNGTVDEVYEHWLTRHADNSLSKPFQFYAVTLANCFHCPKVGTYHELARHHEEEHPAQSFVISDQLDPLKCGVCHFNDGDLVEHFKKKHATVLPLKVLNPIYYSEERLAQLLAINVYKKYQCNECGKAFETEVEVGAHCIIAHDGKVATWKVAGEHENSPIHLICGYCQETVKCNGYLDHFKGHSYNFNCSKCSEQSQDLEELIVHEKIKHRIDSMNHHFSVFPDWLKNKFLNTKMVFGNGLMLRNYNILGTKFDESKLFSVFTEGLLDLKKQRLKQLMEMNEKTERERASAVNRRRNEGQPLSAAAAESEDAALIFQLNEQRKLARHIYINNVPSRNAGRFRDFLPKLWQKLRMKIYNGDIAKVVPRNNSIVVKFHEVSLKNRILERCKHKDIWSNELVQLSRGQAPCKIEIRHYTTPFYFGIWQAAEEYKKKSALHSLRLGEDGFLVKRSPTDAGRICLSKQQLIDYVENKAN